MTAEHVLGAIFGALIVLAVWVRRCYRRWL